MILSTDIVKKCYKCKCEKTLDNFHRDSRTPTGHCGLCKECSKRYIEKNKQRRKEKNDEWRKDNRDLILDQGKLYYDNNKDVKRKYWVENKEILNEKRIIRERSNLIYYLQKNAIERAKKKNLPYDKDFLVNKYTEVPKECEVLHIPIFSNIGEGAATANSPSVDRIDNTRGYVTDNIRIISHRANALKSNASFEELRLIFEDALRINKNKS